MHERLLQLAGTDFRGILSACDSHARYLIGPECWWGGMRFTTVELQSVIESPACVCDYCELDRSYWGNPQFQIVANVLVRITGKPVIYSKQGDHGRRISSSDQRRYGRTGLELLQRTRGWGADRLKPIWCNAVGCVYLCDDIRKYRGATHRPRCKYCGGLRGMWPDYDGTCAVCEDSIQRELDSWRRAFANRRAPLTTLDWLARCAKNNECVNLRRSQEVFTRLDKEMQNGNSA